GGAMSGRVEIAYGKGLAGWWGRRIATKLGLPQRSGGLSLAVRIRSTPDALHWSRTFDGGKEVVSVFTPMGAWPDGYWIERVGSIQLMLRIDTSEGGWRWVPVRTSLWGVPLPHHLVPQLNASKRAVDGQYYFSVAVSHPLLGALFSYSGVLAPD